MEKIKQLATDYANKINNEVEYQLTLQEFFKLRNDEYYRLVDVGEIVDNDDNWDDFDSYVGELLNVNWGQYDFPDNKI